MKSFILLSAMLLASRLSCNALDVSETLQDLAEQFDAARPAQIAFTPPSQQNPRDADRSATLRSSLLSVSAAVKADSRDDFARWQALLNSAVLDACLKEWVTFDKMRSGLLEILSALEKVEDISASGKSEIALRISLIPAYFWMRSAPLETISLLTEIEAQYLTEATRHSARVDWHFHKTAISRQMHEYVQRRSSDETAIVACTDFLILTSGEYARNDAIPLPHRTSAVVAKARHMLASKQHHEAEKVLDEWWKIHAAEIASGEFFNAWFFAVWKGRGDTSKARQIIQIATDRLDDGRMPLNHGDFEAMVTGYYADIFLSEMDLAYEAQRSQNRKYQK